MSSHTLGQEKFLNKFWGKSRLHFIGTWRERYEKLLQTLSRESKEGLEREQHDEPSDTAGLESLRKRRKVKRKRNVFTERQQLINQGRCVTKSGQHYVFHIDMDCFFASVSLRSRPELRDKPVVITSNDKGDSTEISCANYPARAFGLKAGMWLKQARMLCPQLICLPYEFEQYMIVAESMYRALFNLSPFVNGVSCDEAFVDVTHLVSHLDVDGKECARELQLLAQKLKKRILERTGGCTASIGIGENMLLARLATKKAKPDGVFLLSLAEQSNRELLDSMDISEIPQVGWSSTKLIRSKLNASTCRELQQVSLSKLQELFGPKKGETIFKHCRGIDTREWVDDGLKQRQSIGAQSSWGVRMESEEEVLEFLQRLCKEVAERIAASTSLSNKGGRRLTLTVWRARPGADPNKRKGSLGHGICDIFSRSVSLGQPVSTAPHFFQHAVKLYNKTGIQPGEVRGFGLSCSNFDTADTQQTKMMHKWFLQTTNDDSDSRKDHQTTKAIKGESELENTSSVEVKSKCELANSDVSVELPPSPLEFESLFQEIQSHLDQVFGNDLAKISIDEVEECKSQAIFCDGEKCGSSLCGWKQKVFRICDNLWKACSNLECHSDACELVSSCRSYCQFNWPGMHHCFSESCSQMLAELSRFDE